MTIELEPLAPSLGSIVHGLALADADLEGEVGATLRNVLAERQVIFFREQPLSPSNLVRLARVFGQVGPVTSTFPSHPEDNRVEILRSSGRRTGTDVWHADLTWQMIPPRGACLLAVDVPPVGGDTMWASMTAAYDALEPRWKDYLAGLNATHDWETPELLVNVRSGPDADARYAEMRRKHPPVEHPIVRVHPQTGRKLVYVNELYTSRLMGMSRSESSAILRYLTGLAAIPEWQVRFRWQPGSIAIWDNLAVQHYAINDYHPYPRLMHRVAIN